MDLNVGTLLEHIGFSRRSHIHRLAEIIQIHSGGATLYIDNDPNPRSLDRFELMRWWEKFETNGDPLPTWVKKDAVFRARVQGLSNRAVIHSARPGWVSFFDHTNGQPQVFRVVEYEKFHAHWEPDTNPSLWERLLNEDL